MRDVTRMSTFEQWRWGGDMVNELALGDAGDAAVRLNTLTYPELQVLLIVALGRIRAEIRGDND